MQAKPDKPIAVSEGAGEVPTLVPMLVWGLALIIVGMAILMFLV